MKGLDDSEESEEEQRVMKTAKDKKMEEVNGVLKKLKEHLKINDFGQIMEDFEKITYDLIGKPD